jgi:hypothetical protein
MQHKVDLKDFLGKYERWILAPIREDLMRQDRSHFNVFILLSVVLDNLASIRYSYEIPDSEKGAVGKRYRKFIKEYMPNVYKKYAGKLYSGFRCKLVHEFQLNYFDIRQNCPSLHLTEVENKKICLESSCLGEAVLSAFEKLKGQLIGSTPIPQIVEAFSKSSYRGWYAA